MKSQGLIKTLFAATTLLTFTTPAISANGGWHVAPLGNEAAPSACALAYESDNGIIMTAVQSSLQSGMLSLDFPDLSFAKNEIYQIDLTTPQGSRSYSATAARETVLKISVATDDTLLQQIQNRTGKVSVTIAGNKTPYTLSTISQDAAKGWQSCQAKFAPMVEPIDVVTAPELVKTFVAPTPALQIARADVPATTSPFPVPQVIGRMSDVIKSESTEKQTVVKTEGAESVEDFSAVLAQARTEAGSDNDMRWTFGKPSTTATAPQTRTLKDDIDLKNKNVEIKTPTQPITPSVVTPKAPSLSENLFPPKSLKDELDGRITPEVTVKVPVKKVATDPQLEKIVEKIPDGTTLEEQLDKGIVTTTPPAVSPTLEQAMDKIAPIEAEIESIVEPTTNKMNEGMKPLPSKLTPPVEPIETIKLEEGINSGSKVEKLLFEDGVKPTIPTPSLHESGESNSAPLKEETKQIVAVPVEAVEADDLPPSHQGVKVVKEPATQTQITKPVQAAVVPTPAPTPTITQQILPATAIAQQGAWMVDVVPSSSRFPAYCILSGGFEDNMRLSMTRSRNGQGTLGINFGVPILERGRDYAVALNSEGGISQQAAGRATSRQLLVLQLGMTDDFYSQIGNSAVLNAQMPGAMLDFDVRNLTQASGQFNQCLEQIGSAQVSLAPSAMLQQHFQHPIVLEEATPTVAKVETLAVQTQSLAETQPQKQSTAPADQTVIAAQNLLKAAGLSATAQREDAQTVSWFMDGALNGRHYNLPLNQDTPDALSALMEDIDAKEQACEGQFISQIGLPDVIAGQQVYEIETECVNGNTHPIVTSSIYHMQSPESVAVWQVTGNKTELQTIQTRRQQIARTLRNQARAIAQTQQASL